jgi:hypothetical protein
MIAAGAGSATAQPIQWMMSEGGNGHWYEGVRLSTIQTLQTAQADAISRGGYVAAITSAAESAFIDTLAQDESLWMNYYVGPLIGIFTDGDTCLQGCSVSGEPLTFTNWWPGNPDWPATSCCVYLFAHTNLWQNHPCGQQGWDTYPRTYIIEWSADCNNDGLVDKGQILSGQLPDANNNGIPDWSVNINRQPSNQAVGVDQPVFFVVEASSTAGCADPIAYRWQRRNPQVPDDNALDAWIDLRDGGTFLNTTTASLTILRPTAGLATGYRCKISGGCGCEGVSSGVAYTNVVNFAAACPSDFNNDGSVDGDDVIEFFERWDNGC